MASQENLTIVVPVLNEAESIPQFCKDAQRLQLDAESQNLSVSFIFVDNGSQDSSFSLLSSHCQCNPSWSLMRCDTRGYGAALKSGFAAARGDYIGFIDLDSTYPMAAFVPLVTALRSEPKVKMAIGSRLNSESKMPLVRKIGNHLYRTAIKLIYLVNIPDACSGMRVFRAEDSPFILNQTNDGLGFSIQLTCACLRVSWPLHFQQIAYFERSGPSKLSVVRDGLDFLKEIFCERFKPTRSF